MVRRHPPCTRHIQQQDEVARVFCLLLLFLSMTSATRNNGSVLAGLPILLHRYRNCHELRQSVIGGGDGIYVIYPYDHLPERPVRVWCDMTTEGGGWTVIQRRDNYHEPENFYRTWMEYALGFGSPAKDHWLGLDNIHALTDQTLNEIRFDLADFDRATRMAKYNFFYVHSREDAYRLEVNGYSGTAGDAFTRHHGSSFSAKDKDLDSYNDSCAQVGKGAWWYTDCHDSNLNGQYLRGRQDSYADGVNWRVWRGHKYSLKSTIMMIRPRY